MGLWRVDDITSNILFRRKKKIWRKQITTAEIKKKEGQEEEEKEEKEKERKKKSRKSFTFYSKCSMVCL